MLSGPGPLVAAQCQLVCRPGGVRTLSGGPAVAQVPRRQEEMLEAVGRS